MLAGGYIRLIKSFLYTHILKHLLKYVKGRLQKILTFYLILENKKPLGRKDKNVRSRTKL